MDLKVEKQPKNTYKVFITIPKDEIDEAFDHALEHEGEHVEIPGFRKGKAPKNVLREKIDKTKVRSHALNDLLTKAYTKAIKEHKLMPIISPRFDLEVFEEGKDGKLTMIIVEKPEIKLGDYKKELEKLAKSKSSKKDKTDEPAVITNQEIVDAVKKVSKVDLPTELIEEEVNRMMSSLIDQISKMGVTMEQYLESIKKKPQELRDEYTKTAEDTLAADFLITEIAKTENVTVSDEEVQLTINAIPDPKSREALDNPNQRMYVKAILIKNKTLQTLADIATPKKKTETKDKEKKDKVKEEKKTNKETKKKAK